MRLASLAKSRRSSRGRHRLRSLAVEVAEPRLLMAAPVLDPITDRTIPAGKSLILPLTAADADNDPLAYTITSSDPNVTATVHAGNPFLKLSVQNFGDMTFELLRDVAPHTTDIIGGLAAGGFYNNLTFHRVVPNFVIQGGDPLGNGTGGPGFSFNDEFNPEAIFSGDGQLAMANSGRDTNGSQFFVTIGPQRLLDFNHTIFGQLVRGFDVLNAISRVPTGTNNRPTTPIVITSASLVPDNHDAVVTLDARPGAMPATITVKVDDGHGGTDTRTFTLTPVDDATLSPPIDDPPILGPVGDRTAARNQPLTFDLSSTDLEGDAVEYEAVATDATPHATVTLSGHTVTVTPNQDYTGPVKLKVGVKQAGATSRGSDTSNPFDEQNIIVNFVNPTLAPSGVPVHTIAGFSTGTVTVATFTPNLPEPPGAYTAAIQWGDQSASQGTIVARPDGSFAVQASHTYAQKGPYTITVSIHDSVNNLDQSVNANAVVGTKTPGDFDGDGQADLAVWRTTTAQWLILRSSAGAFGQAFGDPSTMTPLQGDFDGDGKADLAVYQPSTAKWFILQSTAGPKVVQFGATNGDVPVPADYDGDGKTDLAVYRPSTAQWFILQSTTGGKAVTFGAANLDQPVPADYDGDGKADLAVWRPTTSQWLILQSTTGARGVVFGGSQDRPVPADYDGDGKADVAVYRPSTSQWFLLQSTAGAKAVAFGAPNRDVPVPADYDGDGKVDLAVYRPDTAEWFILQTSAGANAVSFGGPNIDVPVATPLSYRYAPGRGISVKSLRAAFPAGTIAARTLPAVPATRPPVTQVATSKAST